jgi:hypothetical protein
VTERGKPAAVLTPIRDASRVKTLEAKLVRLDPFILLARREASQDSYIGLTTPFFVALLLRTSASIATVARRGTMLAAIRIGAKEEAGLAL